MDQIWRFLEPCDLEIWRMTFKINRTPRLCYFKLCAAFHSHWWIQTGVTGWKRPKYFYSYAKSFSKIKIGVGLSSFLSSFADNTRITHDISSQDDTEALKQDLCAVYPWAKKNMEFNSDKFKRLRYSHQGYPQTETIYQADLGVTLCDDALFSTYIREKVSAMKLKVGWVICTFKRRDWC